MIPRLILFMVAGLVIWSLIRARNAASVVLTSRGLHASSGLPERLKNRMAMFAQENVPPGVKLKLKGRFDKQGYLRWKIPRNWDNDMAQRLRNFMVNLE